MIIKTALSLFFKKQKNSIYTFQKQERTFRIISQCARSISVSHSFFLSPFCWKLTLIQAFLEEKMSQNTQNFVNFKTLKLVLG